MITDLTLVNDLFNYYITSMLLLNSYLQLYTFQEIVNVFLALQNYFQHHNGAECLAQIIFRSIILVITTTVLLLTQWFTIDLQQQNVQNLIVLLWGSKVNSRYLALNYVLIIRGKSSMAFMIMLKWQEASVLQHSSY